MEMKKYKLGELGEIRMCKRILKEETNTVSGIPFFKIGTFGSVADVFITREKFEEYKAKYSYPKKGDVLISAAGTIGRTVVYNGEDAYFQDSNIVWIENDESKVVNALLYYAYKNVKWKVSNGSTILRLYNDDLRRTEIFVPADISVQKKIASVLSTLDKRIENLRAQNRVLEQTAKTIYDYTFLQCAGHQTTYNKTLNRNIPTNWEVKTIGEILDKVSATTKIETKLYQQSGKYPVIDQSTNFIAGYTDDESAVIRKTPAVFFGDHTRIVKMINFEFARGSDGTQILYSKEQNVGPFYLYFAVKAIDLSNMGYARHFKFLKDKPIAIPDMDTSVGFEKTIQPLFDKILINRKQIEALTTQCNTLLPLLMTGQVVID